MPAFLVHGVPDSSHLWDQVRSHLTRTDVIAPDMPGFSAPVPDGFGATKDEYAAWLIERIEDVGEPVDIVGHDWGSLLVQHIVQQRPDLVRTWAAGGGPVDSDYVWHDMAKMWQTPAVGEQVMASFTPDALAAALTPQGLDAAYAREVGERVDDLMKDCILKLYRSAINVGTDWPMLAAPCPLGLVLWGKEDPYCPVDFGKRLADRTGAKYAPLDSKHWWPHERPAEVASLLEELWSSPA